MKQRLWISLIRRRIVFLIRRCEAGIGWCGAIMGLAGSFVIAHQQSLFVAFALYFTSNLLLVARALVVRDWPTTALQGGFIYTSLIGLITFSP